MDILITLAFLIVSGFLLFFSLKYRRKRNLESQGISDAGYGVFSLMFDSIRGITFSDGLLIKYKKPKSKNISIAASVDFGKLTLVVQDPELLKSILVKDFDHFSSRRQFLLTQNDIVLQKMLFVMTGEKWKILRTKLGQLFTPAKIKRIFQLYNDSGRKLVNFVESEIRDSGNHQFDLTLSSSKYTLDIIASAGCGIDSKAFDQKQLPSQFEQMAKDLQFSVSGFKLIQFIAILMIPEFATWMGWSFVSKELQNYSSEAITASIKHREETGEKRDDFVQFMLDARKENPKTGESETNTFLKQREIDSSLQDPAELFDDAGIIANCVMFLFAGFDTSQAALLFCLYQLAINQDVQERLRSEVEEILNENNGELSYEALNRMTYLEMVINETMRFYPTAPATDRSCTTDYIVPGTKFKLKEGQSILIPIYGIHHDEKFFPEPEKFNPERFSAENKSKINPYTFLPFGNGPRNCVGMRFALTAVRVAVVYMVQNFRIEPSSKTQIPIKFANVSVLKPDRMFLAFHKIVR